MEQIEKFKVIGLTVRTTNENEKSVGDMGILWNRFFSEGVYDRIPNKVGGDILSIYTDYESDYRGVYSAIVGVRVNTLEEIPEGMVGRDFEGGEYLKMTAKGKMPDAVMQVWGEVWEKDEALNRKYSADFEVYGEKSQRGDESEVDLYVAIS